ncbi:TPA: hypothetical protein ACHID3_004961, partial [Escherichia coli]
AGPVDDKVLHRKLIPMNEPGWKALSKAVKRYQDVLSWSRSDRHSPGAERELAAAAGNIRKAIGDQEIDVIVELEYAERKIAVYTLLSWMCALLTLCILYFR